MLCLSFGVASVIGMALAENETGESIPWGIPRDPVAAIAEAVRDHQVVNVGEAPHESDANGRLWLRLLRSDAVMEGIDDVFVESGNSLHQPMVDAFVAGDDVPYASLSRAWIDSSTNGVFDQWMYEEILWAVRARNRLNPGKRQVRVILLGVPIDWSRVKSSQDLRAQERQAVAPWQGEARWVAHRILDTSIRDGRRALVLQGAMHGLKRLHPDYTGDGGSMEMAILHDEFGVSVFSAIPSYVDLRTTGAGLLAAKMPFLVALQGTRLGQLPVSRHFTSDQHQQLAMEAASPKLRQPAARVVDAVIYLEPQSEIAFATPSRWQCLDKDYLAIRQQRLRITGLDADAWLREFMARCDRTSIGPSGWPPPLMIDTH